MLQPKPTAGDVSWFTRDRFGLFIHWGLYALGARHEWVKNAEKLDNAAYEKFFKRFDPDLYDPALWAAAASDAGMKYFVATSKHHEGFCLWDSKLTDYKAPNTAAGRDLLRPMVDAFRARDMRTGFYYSLLDWHHSDYTIDRHHPLRDHPDKAALNQGRDIRRYADYMHGQIRELLSDYGRIDILWCDFSFPGENGKGRDDWQSEKLVKMIRELQPRIILNDRLDLPGNSDVKTPEQYQPRAWVRVDGEPVVWEMCQTFSGSWGYHRDESNWKSVRQLVEMLIDAVSKGGNLLLNVGPTGRGDLDERALSRLAGIGQWMKRHDRSIYGCTQAPDEFAPPQDSRLTYNPQTRRMYVHLFNWPIRHLHLPVFGGKVEYAQLLADASELKMLVSIPEESYGAGAKPDRPADLLTLELPVVEPSVSPAVIELFLK